MLKMPPKRPREHELETLSRMAFERIIPTGWVVREVGRDYGIDLEVEIFEAAESTGMMFKVQLKASEKTGTSGPFRSIKMDTLNYWNNLDVPVLISYYADDTKAMYGRWAHTVGREPNFNPTVKTTTVRFSADEIFSADSLGPCLQKEVETLRALRMGRLPQPLPVRLIAADDTIPGLTASRLGVRLRQAIRDRGLHGDVKLLGPEELDVPAVQVSLTRGADMVLRVALPSDLASVRAVLPADSYHSTDVTGVLADDIFMAIATVVEKTGAVGTAARLFAPTAMGAGLAAVPEIAHSVALVLAQQKFARLAQRLSVRFWRSDDASGRDLGDVYFYGLINQLEELTESERSELYASMRQRATLEQSALNPRRAGRAYYNLAQTLNATNRTWDALDAMDLAVVHDPGYINRDYFFRERGGMRWHVGRYLDAVDDYRRAIDAGGDSGELVPLLADTLLYAGQYAEAEAILAGWAPSGHRLDGLGLLVRTAVAEIREVTGLEQQDRQPVRDDVIAEAGSDAAALNVLLINSDALDARIWLQVLGDTMPLPRLVVIALIVLNSAEAWALATVRALESVDSADLLIVTALINAGERLSHSSFIDAVERILVEFDDDEHITAVRDIVYSLLDRTTEDPPQTTLREIFD